MAEYKPHEYQKHSVQKILDIPYVALFLEMGLGKTVITLTAIDLLLYDTFETVKVLVIAPLRVAEDTWSRESSKWDHTKHLKISKILGDIRQRKKALLVKADIYVINRENVSWLVGYLGKKWNFDTVVIDEISSFKSSNSQRFRALRRVRPLMQRVIGLTGTPAPNGLIDLWAQIYLLDQGERLGTTIGGYRDRYFSAGAKNGNVVYEWKQKKESEQNIYQAIGDIAFSLKAADWLDMPEKIDRVMPVKMGAIAEAQYQRLERDLLLPLADADVVASTAGVLSNKLLQMANGAVYDEDRLVHLIHDGKLDALEDVIEAANGFPVLVFYAYKHDFDRIKKRFPHARTLKTSADIADWNAGKIELLVTHPKSAGHGLNLQDGGNIVTWFGLTWSLEEYQQAIARLFRQGQLKNVIVQHIITLGTIDEDVMLAIESKAAGQDALMAAVKARIERVKAA